MRVLKNVLLLLFIAFMFPTTDLEAQVYDRRGQAIYLEGGGPGIAYSLNYETRFSEKTEGLGGRVGFSYLSDWIAVPINVNYLLGKKDKSHFLELGLGATFVKYPGVELIGGKMKDNQIFGAFTIMYRLHPRYGKFFFKVGITPLVGRSLDEAEDKIETLPWFGIAFGRAF